MDILFAGILLVILSPVFVWVAFWIKIDSGGSVFFRQIRVGKNCKQFSILKFRTMRIDTPADVPTAQLRNPESHITKSGQFLRRTSLDELPQLINILRGEMSFIGPRPALSNQEDLISLRKESGANAVLPGLTGRAQISGRDELEIAEKAQYDADYVQKISFLEDWKILKRTVSAVFAQNGVKEGAKK